MSEVIVVKLTGKLFDEGDRELFSSYIKIFREVIEGGHRLIIVTGGGKLCRDYIELAKRIGIRSLYVLDSLGIFVSRVNAYILAHLLQPFSNTTIPKDLEELRAIYHQRPITVMGGVIPGQSTIATALEVAEALGSSIVVYFTTVNYIYTNDPAIDASAKPLREVKLKELKEFLKTRSLPGEYQLIDEVSAIIAERSRITIYVTKYTNPSALLEIISGGNPGTVVIP
ncbi:MAG: UMP kinase [Sulfolobales archaeon]|nr:UMP kinase [Sulfolobales archaeon]MCX8198587.1 UMP kinase [Sulfolobales archaeon]MDW8169661.1 UMP kinase [Desulfurococcaceae archaeon]